MPRHAPSTRLITHEVFNQPPDFAGRNLFTSDPVLSHWALREGGDWVGAPLAALGAELGREEVLAAGEEANRYPPELTVFDRYGRRIDEVRFHPSYHRLMDLAMEHRIHSIAWAEERPGAHVAHAALLALFSEVEQGTMCPISMTYASVPALRHQPEVAAQWVPKIVGGRYDAPLRPIAEKRGVTIGMAMTEKQGGSDVRANTTRAFRDGEAWRLVGHKWFCSAPMCDAFLTLAQTEAGLSCFLVPRIRPDGERNSLHVMRLKDKLGNKSNASSEIEYHDTHAVLLGEEGGAFDHHRDGPPHPPRHDRRNHRHHAHGAGPGPSPRRQPPRLPEDADRPAGHAGGGGRSRAGIRGGGGADAAGGPRLFGNG